MVIGIGVRFPFLSYRASVGKCQLNSLNHTEWTINNWRRTKERVRQRDCIYLCHRRIINKVRINEKENRHVDSFPGVESLLFKAKALDLAEIWCHLGWSNTVGSDPNDVLGTLICCRVERERCLSGQDADLSLLWREFPWHYVGY